VGVNADVGEGRGPRIELDRVILAVVPRDGRDVLVGVQPVRERGRRARDRVDVTSFERCDECFAARVYLEVNVGEGPVLAPVVGIAHHLDRRRVVLLHDERPGTHAKVRATARHDRNRHDRKPEIELGRGDRDALWTGDPGGQVVERALRARPVLRTRVVDRRDDVERADRRAVRPHETAAEVVHERSRVG